MTRTKQQPNVVKTEPIDISTSDTLDTNQILALLEQNLPAGLIAAKSTASNQQPEQEVHLTPGKASEILFAAGVRPHKKTSEIWEHYKCLNEKQNVECIYCWKVLKRNDSSTKSMWGHMNAYHQDILKEGSTKKKLKRNAALWDMDETPTQPYVKRVRGANGGHNHHSSNNSMSDQKPSMIDSMAFALQQLQQSGSLGDFNTSFNFLDSLPKSSEIINISGGFNGPTSTNSQQNDNDEDDNENHAEAASSSSASADNEPHTRNTDTPDAATPQTPTSSNGGTSFENGSDLAALVSNLASTNPMMLAMLNAANGTGSGSADNHTSTDKSSAESPDLEKDPSSFSLSDGPCAAVLMSMALDLDMTMSYHRRRVDIELCFESNRTAEKSGGRGKVICLTDMGKEIKIVERVNGAVSGTELWTKTDFNQFHWAIRGKCQKCFNKP
ncbi:unnamed protein product [Caenorhabditis angaria]|uniref:BED-type domain-containing protein n=1 Tax=Caenorhabditis angaria TaxID=860376 RepID=A0A9P1IHF7_9PELO|nr:unnamed protein product [Caenorhabditis angaria]